MGTTTASVLYFDEPGPQNTDETLAAGFARAAALGLNFSVVATDSGKTAAAALHAFGRHLRIVAVTNPAGLTVPIKRLHDYLPRFRSYRASLEAQGARHVPASLSDEQHRRLLAAGADAVLRVDWHAISQFVRADLRPLDRIGVGLRVALVVAMTACLAGAIPGGEEVLAVGGTGFGGGGADTAILVRTATLWPDWRITETVARPRIAPPSETR